MTPIAPIRARGPWQLAFERIGRDRAAIVAIVTILLVALIAVAAPLFAALPGRTVPRGGVVV